MRCDECNKKLDLTRARSIVKHPFRQEYKFCSSHCYMEYENKKVREPFRLTDSEEELKTLETYQKMKGYF